VKALIDGTIPNIFAEGQEIFDSLIKYNDEFFVLRDFEDYCLAQESINEAYKDKRRWQKISLNNIAHAGRFSSDSTVQRYAEDIWQIEPVFAHEDDRGVIQHDSYLL
jgi:starch phosphorylase